MFHCASMDGEVHDSEPPVPLVVSAISDTAGVPSAATRLLVSAVTVAGTLPCGVPFLVTVTEWLSLTSDAVRGELPLQAASPQARSDLDRIAATLSCQVVAVPLKAVS